MTVTNGFCVTIELANLGQEVVCLKVGDPLALFVFYWLDEPTEAPYRGKYQNQERRPEPTRFEI